jgi:hypothetical protein
LISNLSELTAPPTGPQSAIAPQELVGKANFPSLLGGFQASGVERKALPEVQSERATKDANGASPEFAALSRSALATRGNGFPQVGMDLPTSLWSSVWSLGPTPNQGNETNLPEPLIEADVTAKSEDQRAQFLPSSSLSPGSPHGDLSTVAPDIEPRMKIFDIGNDRARSATSDELPQFRTTSGEARAVAYQPINVDDVAPRPIGTIVPPKTEPLYPMVPTRANSHVTPPTSDLGTADLAVKPTPQTPEVPKAEQQVRTDDIAGKDRQTDAQLASSLRSTLNTASAEQERQVNVGIAREPAATAASEDAAANSLTMPAIQEAQDTDPLPTFVAQAAPATAAAQASSQRRSEAPPVRGVLAGETRTAFDSRVQRTSPLPSALNSATAITPAQPTGLTASEAEVDPDAPRMPLPAPLLPHSGQANAQTPAGQAPVDFGASQTAGMQPQPSAVSLASQPSAPAPLSDTSSAFRPSPQLESTIDQLIDTRSAAQANRPELTLRHQEFGAITMRLESMGNDLRATLTARDPGFVPAIQTALTERSVAASSEAAGSGAQRGSDQGSAQSGAQTGSQNGQHTGSHGGGWNSGGTYGSSTGAGQGTSQPYTGQTGNRDEEAGSDRGKMKGHGNGSAGDGEIFA